MNTKMKIKSKRNMKINDMLKTKPTTSPSFD